MHKKGKYFTMDTKKILALLTALDKGSLTSAAAELGYTQSGLTHMMNSLENELGLELLIRSKQGVQLTGAGQTLMPEFTALVKAAEALEQSAQALRERSFTTLRLGAYSSISRHWLPSILTAFRFKSPDTEVAITMSTISDTYESVRSGALDCAIVSYQPSLLQGMAWIPLQKDALLAILPASAKEEIFPVESFGGTDFLMPSSGFEMDITPVFSSGSERVIPNIKYTNLDDAAIVSMVAHGLGVSILSELVMQGISDNVKAVPLSPAAWRSLGIIVTQHNRSDGNIKRLIRCAQETVAKMYGEQNAKSCGS